MLPSNRQLAAGSGTQTPYNVAFASLGGEIVVHKLYPYWANKGITLTYCGIAHALSMETLKQYNFSPLATSWEKAHVYVRMLWSTDLKPHLTIRKVNCDSCMERASTLLRPLPILNPMHIAIPAEE